MNKLLLIADMDGPQIALQRGIALAQKLKAEVEILAFCYQSLQDVDEGTRKKVRDALIAQKQAELDKALESIDASSLTIRKKVVWEKVIHKSILDFAEEFNSDLIIKTGHRSERLLYTPTDWHLLRSAKIPVMICAEKKWKRARPIVAALDLNTTKPAKQRLNTKVVKLGKALAETLGVTLEVVCALDIPQVLKDLDLIDPAQYRKKKLAEMEPTIQKLCDSQGLTRDQIHIVTGTPHKVIPSKANKFKADLVVLGTNARAGLKGALQGNTGERVLHHLRTDVVSVR